MSIFGHWLITWKAAASAPAALPTVLLDARSSLQLGVRSSCKEAEA